MATETWVDFTVFIQVRSDVPGAMVEVEEENHALADVNEETNLATASRMKLVCFGDRWEIKGGYVLC